MPTEWITALSAASAAAWFSSSVAVVAEVAVAFEVVELGDWREEGDVVDCDACDAGGG